MAALAHCADEVVSADDVSISSGDEHSVTVPT
jgi:hypothetical protein